jgi:hypothetical protein
MTDNEAVLQKIWREREGDDKNKIEEKGFVTKCYMRAGGLTKVKMDIRRTNKEKGVSGTSVVDPDPAFQVNPDPDPGPVF